MALVYGIFSTESADTIVWQKKLPVSDKQRSNKLERYLAVLFLVITSNQSHLEL